MQKETCLKVEHFGKRGLLYLFTQECSVVVKGDLTKINYRDVIVRARKITCNRMYAYDPNKLINAMSFVGKCTYTEQNFTPWLICPGNKILIVRMCL